LLFRGLLALRNGRSSLITYEVAETFTQRLAAQLSAAFDLEKLRRFHYVAIPRGGHVVLGMLSYILDLPHEALAYPPQDSSTPLVVVDDCALSGHRFARFLEQHPHEQVIFVHLCSHPALREAILAAEPRVIACLAAYDLKDLAEERFPDPAERRHWQQRWRERATGPLYWVGLSELVIFPWNEPDRPVWNPETNQVEDHWRLASPDRCLKNWGKLGLPPKLDIKAVVRIPDQVAYTVQREDVTLCNLADETVYGLDGVAADIWRALAAYGDLSATRDYLLEIYAVDAERVTADIHSLVESLLAKGLLEPVHDLPPT
jgi:hypothetical protein